MKKHLFVLGIFCATLFASCDPDRRTAQNEGYPEADQVPPGDNPIVEGADATMALAENSRQFIEETTSSNRLEVELGQLAQEKAATQEVKDLGKMLAEEHRTAGDALHTLAQNKEVQLPAQLTQEHQERLTKLRGLNGQEFDKEYLMLVAELHQEAIATFEDRLDDVADQDLKQWIETTLPTLRQHKERIVLLQQQVK